MNSAPLRRTVVAAALSLLLLQASAAATIFVERAADSGLEFTYYNGMSGELYLPEVTGGGVALLDYDGDGDLDAYFVQGQLLGPDVSLEEATFPPPAEPPLTDRLFRNDLVRRDDGSVVSRFVDVTDAAGIDEDRYGMGVAVGDVDSDGDPDLYVTNLDANTLWRNRGDGGFERATAAAGVDDSRWSVPATFFDFDRDGALDLFVGNYVDFSFVRHRKCSTASGAPDYCGPLAYSPVTDRLFRNRGDGTFEDVSVASGIAGRAGNALGTVAADADGDGWTDLFVANDQMENFLWSNRSRRKSGSGDGERIFRDEALLAGVAVNRDGAAEASMGIGAGDVDGDSAVDLFLTHLNAETNTLYVNDGTGLFRDRSVESGLGPPSWSSTGFGTALLDYDNDGSLDVLAVNGAVRTIEAQARDREPYPLKQRDQLFRNEGGGDFVEVTDEAGSALRPVDVSRGLAVGDVDGDGDTDATIVTSAGPARLLDNRVGADAAWIGVAPRPATSATTLGSRVVVQRGEASPLTRIVRTDGSYASASDARVRVGLGGSTSIDALEVVWPDGTRQRWRAPQLRRYLIVSRR